MPWTTPRTKMSQHKTWHVFIEGPCHYCFKICDDCPEGITTCNCTAISRADKMLAEENAGVTLNWRE